MTDRDLTAGTLSDVLNKEADCIIEQRKARGQLPTWYRRRDARTKAVSQYTGKPMSNRTHRRLHAASERGCPELLAAMDAGTVTIAAAAELARLSHDDQRKLLANVKLCKVVIRVLRGDRKRERHCPHCGGII
jgi:hypothetical protein